MEPSRFNTLLKADPSTRLVFNHVRGECAEVSEAVFSYLGGEPGAAVSDGELESLQEQGLVVLSRDREMELVRRRLGELRHAGDAVHFSVVLTYACNLRCPYCYEEAACRRNAHMSKETALRVVEHVRDECTAAAAKNLGITLYGGEPLLNLAAAYTVVRSLHGWCAERGIGVHANLISNGTLVTRTAIRPLLPALRCVQLTLDGGREHHDSVRIGRSRKGTFDRVLAAAELFLEHGVRVLLRIQVTPESLAGVGGCLAELRRRDLLGRAGVGLYIFPILDVGGVCSAKAFSCYKKYFTPGIMAEIEEVAASHSVSLFDLPRPVWQRPYCSFVNAHSWIVDPLGEKYKCVSMIGLSQHVAGSAVRRLEGAEARELATRAAAFVERSGCNIGRCRSCEYLPSCDGGCAYRALVTGGTLSAPSCEMHGEALRTQILAGWRQRRRQGGSR